MIGEYVMTQRDRMVDLKKNDSIGLGSYTIDTHNDVRYPLKTKEGTYRVVYEG